jgi:RNA polymerase sigma-70 factor, ECF subfamily
MNQASTESSDEDLMIRYAGGDEIAFRMLFHRYAPIVSALIRRTIRSTADVQDVVQQVFVRLHRARHDYRSDRAFRPWLTTIALNLRRDLARKAYRRRETGLDTMRAEAKASSGHEIERFHAAQALRGAMDKLSARNQEILELHWFEGFTFGEVAEILGMNRSAVKVSAHRSYKVLRREIEAQNSAAHVGGDGRDG